MKKQVQGYRNIISNIKQKQSKFCTEKEKNKYASESKCIHMQMH